MKKLTLSLCALVALGSAAFAGTETYSKESTSVAPPPCPQWYADNEFNLGISGIYAATGNEWREDTYLGVDHAWGGGIDAKYFVRRYFGFGVQGYILGVNSREVFDDGFTRFRGDDENRHAVGSILGTVTLRFPIACSRFAPYVWLGGGGIFGGGRSNDFFILNTEDPQGSVIQRQFDESDSKLVGQVGGGFEIRFTPRVGLLNDFSWNMVEGTHNNFGMARTGINFAF